MISTKMFLKHLDDTENSKSSNKIAKKPASPRTIKKRALQNRNNNKENSSSQPSKNSIKNFFADVPNVSCDRKRKLTIFEDADQSAKKSKTISTQTPATTTTIDLICSEEPTPKYWELLAEERRKALDEALVENKQLADEIEVKDKLINDLQCEVENLEEQASQAQYLASVIEELGKECLSNEADEDTQEEENEKETTSIEKSSCDETTDQEKKSSSSEENVSSSFIPESTSNESSSGNLLCTPDKEEVTLNNINRSDSLDECKTTEKTNDELQE